MEALNNKLISVLLLLGTSIEDHQIEVVDRGVPHVPIDLPKGKMAIYMFEYNAEFLKIGKVGSKSNARFVNHHYNPSSSNSNLAKSILADESLSDLMIEKDIVGDWIKGNTRRIDILIDASLGVFVLNVLEACLHFMHRPRYEGFDRQR